MPELPGEYPAYLLDADPQVGELLQPRLRQLGFVLRRFATAAEFLGAGAALPRGCLILEVDLPDASGLAVQRIINQRALPLHLAYFSRRREVAAAVQALQLGAVDFVCKQQGPACLLPALRRIAGALRQPSPTALRKHPYAPVYPI